MASVLIWGALILGLVDTSEPSWPQYHRSWILSCLFETSLCILNAVSYSQGSRYDITLLALEIFRVVCSFMLAFHASFHAIYRAIKNRDDRESQWLLANDTASQALYGTTPTHGDESENVNAHVPSNSRGWPFLFHSIYSGCSDTPASNNNEVKLVAVKVAVHD
ncbi:hypothetical protein MMC29_000247 [Sticta canariensis]|nr:hypothetical protein [Sticta canariensis]